MERKVWQVVMIGAVLVLAAAVAWAAWEVRELRKIHDDTNALMADGVKHLGQIERLAQIEWDYVSLPSTAGKLENATDKLNAWAGVPRARPD